MAIDNSGSIDALFSEEAKTRRNEMIDDPFVRGNPETRQGSLNLGEIGIEGSIARQATPNESPVSKIADSTDAISKQMQKNSSAKFSLAAASFVMDVMNANSRFNQIEAKATTNIFLARQSASDAISRGKQRAFELQQRGDSQADQALVALAAQGQDVSGAGAQRVAGSFEVAGIYNSMIAEINASREALGFEQEIEQYESLIESADLQRDLDILGSGLNLAATAAFL